MVLLFVEKKLIRAITNTIHACQCLLMLTRHEKLRQNPINTPKLIYKQYRLFIKHRLILKKKDENKAI